MNLVRASSVFAFASVLSLACSSAPVAPLSVPTPDGGTTKLDDGGHDDARQTASERPDVGAQCGAIEECNCKDGTRAVAGCHGASTCVEACAAHGGVEPEGQCATGETACENECVNLQTGSGAGYNCGACGVICPEYSACVAGKCKVSLPGDAGSFACTRDADCPSGEPCVLNANANCAPFCAETCAVADGGVMELATSCTCGAAIDVGTSAPLYVCLPAAGGC